MKGLKNPYSLSPLTGKDNPRYAKMHQWMIIIRMYESVNCPCVNGTINYISAAQSIYAITREEAQEKAVKLLTENYSKDEIGRITEFKLIQVAYGFTYEDLPALIKKYETTEGKKI